MVFDGAIEQVSGSRMTDHNLPETDRCLEALDILRPAGDTLAGDAIDKAAQIADPCPRCSPRVSARNAIRRRTAIARSSFVELPAHGRRPQHCGAEDGTTIRR